MFLLILAREAVEIHRPNVEIAAVTFAGQEDLRDSFAVARQAKLGWIDPLRVVRQPGTVVLQERAIRHRDRVPAPHPLIVQRKQAGALDAAAEVAITGCTGREGPAIGLEDTRATDRIGAVHQPLAKFAFEQQPLLGGDHRRDRRVVAWRQRKVIRGLDRKAVDRARARARHQKSALAHNGRIRRREVRQVKERLTEKFDPRVLEVDHLLALIVDDPGGLHLPQRRPFRIVPAGQAGGVDAAFEHGEIAAGAASAGGGNCGAVRPLNAQRVRQSRRDNHPTGPSPRHR